MSDKASYQDRLKKMKDAIEKNKDRLSEEFPEEATYSGNTDLLKNADSDVNNEKKKIAQDLS